MADQQVSIIINAKDRASAVLRKFGLNLNTLAAGAVAAFAVKLGVDAVRAAANFEKSMSDVGTLLGEQSSELLPEYSDAVKDIIRVSPKSGDELGAAAYQIVSAGLGSTAEQMKKVLDSSQRLAVAGLGTVEESADLLTSAINAFGIEAVNADTAANILFETVKAGKTTVAELSQSFGNVASLANTAGVSFEELQAATAALTTSGVKTSVAQTQIRAAIQALLKPTKEMSDAFEILNVKSGQELIATSDDIVDVFHAIENALGGNIEKLGKAFGSIEGLNAVLALTNEQGDTFTQTLDAMREGTDSLDIAVRQQLATFDSQVKLLKNQWNLIMIDIGSRILPTVTRAMLSFTTRGREGNMMLNTMIDGLKSIRDAYIKVRDAINSAADAVTRFVNIISGGGAVGISGFLERFSPFRFQAGGIVPGPLGQAQLAVVHGGETVVPSGRLSSTKSGVAININVSGNTIANEADADNLAEKVMNSVMRALKVTQNI